MIFQQVKGTYWTCISGSIPFPYMAAIIDMEVKPLIALENSDFSKE